ncbi:hypothetical protein KIN20_020485 [Parelaphostrongylus tenuis]|uniref:Uncharacterized protein n=1 Tax=Parelaphostrongylus tenuis TaxID=148309 RepID=A0AAD5QTR9_PARTN|nr:hypothetical protein KIN20_020485 [Parelaphostrongylus tenuis]
MITSDDNDSIFIYSMQTRTRARNQPAVKGLSHVVTIDIEPRHGDRNQDGTLYKQRFMSRFLDGYQQR